MIRKQYLIILFKLIWVINRYYDLYRNIKCKNLDSRITLPAKSFKNAMVILTGLAPGSFDKFTEEQLNVELLNNWMMVGEVCLAIFQIAQRSRLSI